MTDYASGGTSDDAIWERRRARLARQAGERASELAIKRRWQQWSDAWRAMAEPEPWQPIWKWSDESTSNLSELAEVVQQCGNVNAVKRIAERIECWLAQDEPLNYRLPVETLKVIPSKDSDRYKLDCMEGILACCRVLIAAGKGDEATIETLTHVPELIRPIHWGRLEREVSLNPDLPVEPKLIGPRMAKCGICRKEWPLADDHTGPVLCPKCTDSETETTQQEQETASNVCEENSRIQGQIASVDYDEIAKGLSGNWPEIFRYLADHPRGVTFNEFQMAYHPVTGHRLTDSNNPDSIATMLRKLSQSLARHKLKIYVGTKQNLIRLEKRK